MRGGKVWLEPRIVAADGLFLLFGFRSVTGWAQKHQIADVVRTTCSNWLFVVLLEFSKQIPTCTTSIALLLHEGCCDFLGNGFSFAYRQHLHVTTRHYSCTIACVKTVYDMLPGPVCRMCGELGGYRE